MIRFHKCNNCGEQTKYIYQISVHGIIPKDETEENSGDQEIEYKGTGHYCTECFDNIQISQSLKGSILSTNK